MIRLAGLLTGAIAALALLLLLIGVPGRPMDAGTGTPAPDAVAPMAASREMPPEPAIMAAVAPSPVATEVTPELAPDPAPSNAPARTAHVPAPMPVTDAPPEPPSANDERHWQAFWSPFRTEIAANGFVAELQRTTGLDYRVVRLQPGVFEVAFAYSDAADAARKLALIADAGGLDITAAR